MKEIVPSFSGEETIMDVSKHLTGIIFIKDNSIKNDSVTICSYMNPNALNKSSLIKSYLEDIPSVGDKRGIFDDFAHDNY